LREIAWMKPFVAATRIEAALRRANLLRNWRRALSRRHHRAVCSGITGLRIRAAVATRPRTAPHGCETDKLGDKTISTFGRRLWDWLKSASGQRSSQQDNRHDEIAKQNGFEGKKRSAKKGEVRSSGCIAFSVAPSSGRFRGVLGARYAASSFSFRARTRGAAR
jgi:hypothetical protein